MPKVSVIIPTHQRTEMVVEAIESVIQQTYQDYEILVIDDSSTDNTRDVLEAYIDQNKILYHYTEVSSAAAARNLALDNATGEYVAFLDSDDLWIPEKLALQVAYFEDHPEIGLLHGGFSKFDNDGRHLGYRDTSRLSGNIYPKILSEWSTLIMISTVMVPLQVINNVGNFHLLTPCAEDLELWARIARVYHIHGIPSELARVREHHGNISGNKISRPDNFINYLNISFKNDLNINSLMKRRILSKMYANSGKNLLGAVGKDKMKFARKYSLKSLSLWLFQLESFINIAVSWLPEVLRERLYKLWLQYSYRLPPE